MEPAEHSFDDSAQRRSAKTTRAVKGGKGKKDAAFWKAPLTKDGEKLPDLHGATFDRVEVLWNVWRRMRADDRRHDVIYENRALKIGGKLHLGVKALEMAGLDASELAVTTAVVDTFDARFSKRKTLPMVVVDDAEWSIRLQAEDFGRWLHGKLREVEFERIYGECVTDMLVRGDGVAYIDEGEDDVFCERVHRSELLVDPYEAKRGEKAVRTLYRFRTISRDVLLEMFPEHADAINACPIAPVRDDNYTSDWLASESKMGDRDVVDLVEAWHPPLEACGPDEDGGGRKLVCIANATLCYAEWKSPRFPFARFTFKKPRRGYWGSGLVERLEPAQRQINRMVADIAQNVAVTGKGIWITPEQGDVPVEKLSGYRPFKLTYRGVKPPEFRHPEPVSSTTLALLEKKIAWAHEMVGAAQWSAQGRSPLGAGASAVAIDTMEDLLSDRHSKQEESCSLGRLDAAQCFLDAAGRVAARRDDEPANDNEEDEAEEYEDDRDDDDDEGGEGGAPAAAAKLKAKEPAKPKKRGYYATWMDKGRLERLNWHDVAMTPDQYRLQLEPVSFLSQTRSGKLAQTAELIKTGVIEQQWAAELYEEPDLAHVNRVRLAPRANAQRLMGVVGNPKKPMPVPEEWHDLAFMLELTKAYYNRAQNEIDEDDPDYATVTTRYREFGDIIQATIDRIEKARAEKAAAMAPPPMSGPGGMPPPGMPPDPMAMPPGPPMPGAPPMPIDPMAAPLPVAA